ncbi:dCTP deaminase [Candidatus Thorarchaeota archaeon]|jgi:dCTP deaminase|nr:MAG: dCTP deaminase [Candidatus Thorarchaeota archaeon]
MMLSDRDIFDAIEKREVRIEPFARENVGPCSVDLTLDSVFRVYGPGGPVDIHDDKNLDRDTKVVNTGEEPYMILPGQFILGQTRERISLSAKYAALLEGRSSIARLGVIVHSAGLVNPGTGVEKPGKLTLEIYCENLSPVLLYPGMRIVQVMFVRLSSEASVQYDSRQGSRYVGQGEPKIR